MSSKVVLCCCWLCGFEWDCKLEGSPVRFLLFGCKTLSCSLLFCLLFFFHLFWFWWRAAWRTPLNEFLLTLIHHWAYQELAVGHLSLCEWIQSSWRTSSPREPAGSRWPHYLLDGALKHDLPAYCLFMSRAVFLASSVIIVVNWLESSWMVVLYMLAHLDVNQRACRRSLGCSWASPFALYAIYMLPLYKAACRRLRVIVIWCL